MIKSFLSSSAAIRELLGQTKKTQNCLLSRTSAALKMKRLLQFTLLVAAINHFNCELPHTSDKIGESKLAIHRRNGFEHQASIRWAMTDSLRFGAGHLCTGSLIDSSVSYC